LGIAEGQIWQTVSRTVLCIHYDTQAWANLKKCWKGFIIANNKGDEKKMLYYTKGIMKFQKQLGLEIRIFPRFGSVKNR